MFTELQNMIDSDEYTNEQVSNELEWIIAVGGITPADRRLAAFLLFLHQSANTQAPDAVEVATYDDRLLSCGREDYLVVNEGEANERWNQSLEDYIDDLILPELPEAYRNYFDVEAWKRDAKFDGRGHCLASYDGEEHYSRGYYIYRVN